jgi:tripartite-type tricarboxylate transporter receptor subunit TctC
MRTRTIHAVVVATSLAAVFALPACAADYPDKPVRYIVAFAPGGLNDIVARLVAQKVTEAWTQSVVVDKRKGRLAMTCTSAFTRRRA